MGMVATTLAEKVDAAMPAVGIANRADLAKRCGIKEPTLSESLKGASDNIRLRTLLRLAKVLNLSVEYLIEGIDPEYDATRVAAPLQEQVVALWQLAVQRGQASIAWGVLCLTAGRPAQPMPNPPQTQPSPDLAPVG